ncbi:MAG: adenylate/guanylate cyclase domain-containing protein [Proteobacteria bacterium]|nr:adenylate/guanylate cyclase domain-containing protein [Pseudomonadota bacterium]
MALLNEIVTEPTPSDAARVETARERAAPIVTTLMARDRRAAARMAPLFDSFVGHLRAAGLPIARASMHITQLHPQLAARSLVWDLERGGTTTEMGHEYSIQSQDAYLASPIRVIREGGAPIRRRIERPDCRLDFPILKDLKERGFTEYTIRPLTFSGGTPNAISIATDRPGGFSEPDLAVLDATLPAFAAVAELQQLRRTARDLLNTYVGPNTGERIFSGAVKRGDGEIIHAVLWYCDLRGFTALVEKQPLAEVLALLDAYFDAIAQPVVARGGEILKFMGDAMLVIFPCEQREQAVCGACDLALEAAEEAVERVRALNDTHRPKDGTTIECGVAVHVGEVMYGNIGAADRLDFTVIGRAVNLVARLSKLCADLDQAIVISDTVSGLSRRELVALGRHELKGIDALQEVFTIQR